jgi:hypothetical protein
MNLQEKLDAQKREFESSAPKEVQEIMRQAAEALRRSGISDRAKGVGDHAPGFALSNQRGETVALKDRLSEGPVVLGFYRGRW